MRQVQEIQITGNQKASACTLIALGVLEAIQQSVNNNLTDAQLHEKIQQVSTQSQQRFETHKREKLHELKQKIKIRPKKTLKTRDAVTSASPENLVKELQRLKLLESNVTYEEHVERVKRASKEGRKKYEDLILEYKEVDSSISLDIASEQKIIDEAYSLGIIADRQSIAALNTDEAQALINSLVKRTSVTIGQDTKINFTQSSNQDLIDLVNSYFRADTYQAKELITEALMQQGDIGVAIFTDLTSYASSQEDILKNIQNGSYGTHQGSSSQDPKRVLLTKLEKGEFFYLVSEGHTIAMGKKGENYFAYNSNSGKLFVSKNSQELVECLVFLHGECQIFPVTITSKPFTKTVTPTISTTTQASPNPQVPKVVNHQTTASMTRETKQTPISPRNTMITLNDDQNGFFEITREDLVGQRVENIKNTLCSIEMTQEDSARNIENILFCGKILPNNTIITEEMLSNSSELTVELEKPRKVLSIHSEHSRPTTTKTTTTTQASPNPQVPKVVNHQTTASMTQKTKQTPISSRNTMITLNDDQNGSFEITRGDLVGQRVEDIKNTLYSLEITQEDSARNIENILFHGKILSNKTIITEEMLSNSNELTVELEKPRKALSTHPERSRPTTTKTTTTTQSHTEFFYPITHDGIKYKINLAEIVGQPASVLIQKMQEQDATQNITFKILQNGKYVSPDTILTREMLFNTDNKMMFSRKQPKPSIPASPEPRIETTEGSSSSPYENTEALSIPPAQAPAITHLTKDMQQKNRKKKQPTRRTRQTNHLAREQGFSVSNVLRYLFCCFCTRKNNPTKDDEVELIETNKDKKHKQKRKK